MLNDKAVEILSKRLTNRIDKLNEYVLETIGKRIKEIGALTPSQASKLIQTLRYGGDLDKIANKIAEVSGLNIQDIYDIFGETAKIDLNFAKEFYDYRGIKFIPYEDNIFLQQQVKALARQTASKYLNFTNTLAFTKVVNGRTIYNGVSKTYRDTLDNAFLSIVEGKETYQEAMYRTIKELGSSGLKTVDYAGGYSRRLDSAVRMNLMDGVRQLHNEVQRIIGEDINYDGIEISVHENPAPDHAPIQGHQYSIAEFEILNNGLDRPISTLNCYHYIFSIILGISKPQYTQKELNEINKQNDEGFKIDGRKYTMYEGTQIQRQLETEIRKQKDIQIIAKASGNDKVMGESQLKITELTNKYRELSKISGLQTQMQRMRVSGYKRKKVGL